MIYVTSRRWGDNVWVRSNDIILPNLAQVGHVWEDGSDPKEFSRVAITRWTVPLDNTTCRIIGWRHFHPDADPRGAADETKCGPESVDFFGQGPDRPYEERQRIPGDYDAQTSQRPVAIHALENLTKCDTGVARLRHFLRRGIRRVAEAGDPELSPVRSNGLIPTYCHDTVLRLPIRNGASPEQDKAFVLEVGKQVTKIVAQGEHQSAADRTERVRALIREYAERSRMALAQ